MNGLAPGSYHIAGQKTKDGQEDIPKPVGKVWLANGIYPGWQVLKSPEDKPSFTDPREPGPDKEEVGRGSLDVKMGKFKSVTMVKGGLILDYEISGTEVQESLQADPKRLVVKRLFRIGPSPHTLALIVKPFGESDEELLARLTPEQRKIEERRLGMLDRESGGDSKGAHFDNRMGHERLIKIPPHDGFVVFEISHSMEKHSRSFLGDAREFPDTKLESLSRWPQTLTTKATLSQKEDAYVVDDIPASPRQPVEAQRPARGPRLPQRPGRGRRRHHGRRRVAHLRIEGRPAGSEVETVCLGAA